MIDNPNLIQRLLLRLAGFREKPISREVTNETGRMANRPHPLGPIQDADIFAVDWNRDVPAIGSAERPMLSALDFPQESDFPPIGQNSEVMVGDSAFVQDSGAWKTRRAVADDVTGQGTNSVKGNWSSYTVPEALSGWYASQSFIGYQACGIFAQHWLVDKACTKPGEDAVRNGWEISLADEDSSSPSRIGMENDAFISKLEDLNEKFNLKQQLTQAWRFNSIYGIRVIIPIVESDDPDYYSKPFNIDGVAKGSYKGLSQVDPYWMMPTLTAQESGNPVAIDFYNPSWWVIGGKRFHRSHLIILRGPEPADILKPTYIFGGIPLVQRIMERVYNAERSANEGPMLLLTKRTTVVKTNLDKIEMQPAKFKKRIAGWMANWTNFGVKTIGQNDEIEQTDTNLSDLDTTIMNQFQLVASIAEIPATELLGTSPKGFNATGEFEMKSYHGRLESIQSNYLQPILERHNMLLVKSEFGVDIPTKVTWKPVASMTALELAEINSKKVADGDVLIQNGSISPDEERNRLKNDPHSGYKHLGEEQASEIMGGSPENEADLITAEAKETAAVTPGATPSTVGANPAAGGDETNVALTKLRDMLNSGPAAGVIESDSDGQLMSKLVALRDMLNGGATLSDSEAMNLLNGLYKLFQNENPSPNPREDGVNKFTGNNGATVKPSVKSSSFRSGDAGYSDRVKVIRHIAGVGVEIENQKGSIRAGNEWRVMMEHDYGFIPGVIGADGDELDAFVGPHEDSKFVFIVNQVGLQGEFDEHKILFGFRSAADAEAGYLSNFKPGWDGMGSIHGLTVEQFHKWLSSGDTAKPYSHNGD